ncbi:MAG: ATP-binding protein, partial [Burkholderiales bacterium]
MDTLNAIQANAQALQNELEWFERVLQARLDLYFGRPSDIANVRDIAPPELIGDVSEYAKLVAEFALGFDERLVLILALAPHIRPQALDTLFVRNKTLERGCTEFGGWKGKSHGGFLPTCETAAFLLAGEDLAERFDCTRLFEEEHLFNTAGILHVEHTSGDEPFFSATLRISAEYLRRLTTGENRKPDHGFAFPAKRITTPLGWNDLVLAPEVLDEIESINAWTAHSHTIMHDWGLAKNIKPGYRSLFYGPPGTGKTLTAILIGQAAKVDVYRIDLSMVVSKYIGETEKNLASVFDQARNKHWILFFDEADALFGKRTET